MMMILLDRFDRLVYLGISDDITSRVKILTALTRK